MSFRHILCLSAFIMPPPFAAADNIADCEVLIAERIEDEGTGGSALISSYRPAGAFISSVYDDEDGHIREIDGHKIRALLCQRRRAIPTLRDYPLLETGIPLTLSQNFDSALSDVVITRFKDGAFRADYTGPGLSEDEKAELDDVIDVFNLQPNDLAAREAAQKTTSETDEVVDEAPAEDRLDEKNEVEVNEATEPSIEIVTLEPDESASTTEEPLAQDTPLDKVADVEVVKPEPVEIVEGPPSSAAEALNPNDVCLIVARDALGQLQELPISAAGLQETLEAASVFVFPVPPGLNLRAIKCQRDSLTPNANDYKVARAGYPFFYQVEGDNKRAAALEFTSGKFRMNLLEGEFTAQELIDAKARILSFNDQHLKDIAKSLSELKKGEK